MANYITLFMISTQVGNGCIGNKVGSCGHEVGLKIHMEFYHNHALISEARIGIIIVD